MADTTQEEILCAFMEPRPTERAIGTRVSSLGWWEWMYLGDGAYVSVPSQKVTSLGSLHEIEARLTDEQWERYGEALAGRKVDQLRHVLDYADVKAWIHASAEQKIAALASVIGGAR